MARFHGLGRRAALAGAFVSAAACTSARGVPPFYEHEEGLPGGLSEDRAAFGLASRTRGEDGALLSAIRPFVAKAEDGTGREKLHVLSPIGSRTRNAKGERTTVWPFVFDEVFGTDEEHARAASDDDSAILPFLMWGHEPDEGRYFAAFPFYGTLKGKLLADRIDFVAFPAYAHTQTGDWQSTHVLWPLVAWGSSPTRSHARFLPFWSQSDSPTRSSRTLLWPFANWATETKDGRTFDSWFVFPFAGRRTTRDGEFREWTALYPFFEFSHDDRTGDDSRAVFWPIHKHVVRPGRSETTWWWPAYGTYRSETERSSFYAWPVVWESAVTSGRYVHRHMYVVPVWMHRSTETEAGEPVDDEVRSWPLFDWRRRGDGYETVRIPEIVPFFGWEPGETLYADLLTLFRWRGDREGRVAWDGPLGIVRYRRSAQGAAKLTLLWWIDIPLGGGS